MTSVKTDNVCIWFVDGKPFTTHREAITAANMLSLIRGERIEIRIGFVRLPQLRHCEFVVGSEERRRRRFKRRWPTSFDLE